MFSLFGIETPEIVTNNWAYLWHVLFLILGLVMLVKGADWFVEGASSVAKKFKIPVIVIGLTVVSFGTSAPELAVSLTSSINGDNGIALGNVVGSNIMNLLVVLGLSAVISPIAVKRSLIKREFPFLFATTILLIIFSIDNFFAGYSGIENILSRGEALIFIFGIIAFCYISIVMAKKDQQMEIAEMASTDVPQNQEEEIKELPLWKTLVFLILGLLCIVFGSDLVTTPAKVIAQSIGDAAGLDKTMVVGVVGLTVVAIGTSLPELVTSVVASKKGENEIAIGNVVGSNIFNILLICGLCGLIIPLSMGEDVAMITDMIISFFATLIVFLFCRKGTLTKKNGWILCGIYVIYLVYLLLRLFLKNEGIDLYIPF